MKIKARKKERNEMANAKTKNTWEKTLKIEQHEH